MTDLMDMFGLMRGGYSAGIQPARCVQDYADHYLVIIAPVLPPSRGPRRHTMTARERHELRALRDITLEVLSDFVHLGRKTWVDHAQLQALRCMDNLRVTILDQR